MAENGPSVIWPLMLAVAVVGSNSLALSPVLGDVAAELHAPPVAVAQANAAYGGATAASALLLGSLVDRLGPARVLIPALGVMAAAMFASAAATGWPWLAAAQALAGAAAGAILPAIYAWATDVATEGHGAQVLGRVLTGWSVSLVAGVPLSALIAQTLSWRVSYLLLAGLLLIASGLLRRGAATQRATRRQERGPAPGAGWVGRLRETLAAPCVTANLTVCFLFMTAFYGVYAYIGDHLRAALGLTASQAGLAVLSYGVGFGLAAFGDRILDRVGPGRLLPIVLSLNTLIYVGLAFGTVSFAATLALTLVWGFVNHFGLNIIVLRLTGAAPDHRGAVLALNSTAAYLGALAGVGAFGLVYDRVGFAGIGVMASLCVALAALTSVVSGRERQILPTA